MAQARNKISKIASDCKNPERAYRSMMTGITARYKLDKAYYRLDMMREMAKYNLVINSTEKLIWRERVGLKLRKKLGGELKRTKVESTIKF